MAMLLTQTALICKNCFRPTLLPEPKSPGVTATLRNFLCRSCGHVYEYGADDYRSLDPPERPQPQKPQQVACIQVACGKDGCAGLLAIRTLMDFDADPRAEAPGIMVRSYAHNVPCGKGHLLSGPCSAVGSFDAVFDEQWERQA